MESKTLQPRRIRYKSSLSLLIATGILSLLGCGRVDTRWKAREEAGRPAGPSRPARGTLDDVIEELRRQVKADPAKIEPRLRLAEAYLGAQRFGEAAQECSQILSIDPRNVKASMILSQALLRAGDVAGALKAAQTASKLKPDDPEVLTVLAIAQKQAGKNKEANENFKKALKLRPRDPALLLNAAKAAAQDKNWQEAEENLKKAAKLVPEKNKPAIQLLLADLFLQQGRPVEATAELQRLAREDPDNALVHNSLGQAWVVQKQYDKALQEFAKAHRLAPKSVDPLLRAGQVYIIQKDYEGAVEQFQKALQISPDSQLIQTALAGALLAQGREEQAIEVYEKILVKNPKNAVALNNLAYLYAEKGQDLDQAFQYAKQAAEAFPTNHEIKDTLGWVYYQQGRYQEALSSLQEAVRLAPQRGLYQYHLAKALLALGQREEARKSFQTALSLGLEPEQKKDAEAVLRKTSSEEGS